MHSPTLTLPVRHLRSASQRADSRISGTVPSGEVVLTHGSSTGADPRGETLAVSQSAAVAQKLSGEAVRLLVVLNGYLAVNEHMAVADCLLYASPLPARKVVQHLRRP